MATFLDWLKDQGNNLVDAARADARAVIEKYSNAVVDLERNYRALYLVRQKYAAAKMTFPHEVLFQDASDKIDDERAMRYRLLKMMHAVGANPAAYGLAVYGLSKKGVDAAYPGLRYNPAELNAAPALFIGAAVLLALAIATMAILAVVERMKKINYVEMQAAVYEKSGYTPEAALNQARKDVATVTGQTGIFASLGETAKWGALAALAWVLYRAMGNAK